MANDPLEKTDNFNYAINDYSSDAKTQYTLHLVFQFSIIKTLRADLLFFLELKKIRKEKIKHKEEGQLKVIINALFC